MMRRLKTRKHPMNATLTGVEELDLFPTTEAREKAITEYASTIKGWDLLLGIGICIVVALGSLVLAKMLVVLATQVAPFDVHPLLRELLTFGIVGICMYFTLRLLHRWGVRRDMRKRLINAGVPVCTECGYLLRALPATSTACPECGAAIEDRARALLQISETPAADSQ